MATTKRRSTAKSTTKRRTSTARKSSPQRASSRRSDDMSPYVTAALATGAVTAIAAAAAGAWFFRNSDKSFSETAEELGGKIKDGIADARSKAETSARSFKDKAAMFFADEPDSQHDIAEEAMRLKKSDRKTEHPVDDTIESELKTGAISY